MVSDKPSSKPFSARSGPRVARPSAICNGESSAGLSSQITDGAPTSSAAPRHRLSSMVIASTTASGPNPARDSSPASAPYWCSVTGSVIVWATSAGMAAGCAAKASR